MSVFCISSDVTIHFNFKCWPNIVQLCRLCHRCKSSSGCLNNRDNFRTNQISQWLLPKRRNSIFQTSSFSFMGALLRMIVYTAKSETSWHRPELRSWCTCTRTLARFKKSWTKTWQKYTRQRFCLRCLKINALKKSLLEVAYSRIPKLINSQLQHCYMNHMV